MAMLFLIMRDVSASCNLSITRDAAHTPIDQPITLIS